MERYPVEFANGVKEMAYTAQRFATAKAAEDGDAVDEMNERAEELKGSLLNLEVLGDDPCCQIKDMAFGSASITVCEVILEETDRLEDMHNEFHDACQPTPDEVSEDLWKRTEDLFWASARLACAEFQGEDALIRRHQRAFNRHARYIAGFGKVSTSSIDADSDEYASRAAKAVPATVIMFSGCKDSQTSADVYNTDDFNLPSDAGPGGAGGACTNSMIKALSERDDYSWVELLQQMQGILDGQYTQIPQLSSSRQIDLGAPYSPVNPEGEGRRKALLVGINYVGTGSELRGCHNDVETMRRYLVDQGFSEDDMRIMMDDGESEYPDKERIIEGMRWLSEDASPGDSLFFHYSGHGASIRDDNGDEPDGKDEALCPADYSEAGLLRDDDVYCYLVGSLCDGVHLTAVLDCCHSGTILDLPYKFRADEDSLAAVSDGSITCMQPNPDFDFGKILQVVQDHPGLCVAAAACAGVALVAMGSENRQSLGSALFSFAQSFG